MTWIIRHFAPFWAMKRAIIKAALSGMSETVKVKMFGEVIASEIPRYRIGLMPYRLNPDKKRKKNPPQGEISKPGSVRPAEAKSTGREN